MVSVTRVQILLFQWRYSGIAAIRPRSFACVLYEKMNHIYLINLDAFLQGKIQLTVLNDMCTFITLSRRKRKPH